MATPFAILNQLIDAQPSTVQPVFRQIVTMHDTIQNQTCFKNTFNQHTADNENVFNQIQLQHRAAGDRLSTLETGMSDITNEITKIKSIIDQNNNRINDELSNHSSRLDKVGQDGSNAVDTINTSGK